MKKILTLFLLITVLTVSGCAASKQQADLDATKNIVMKFVKIDKLYRCHYFYGSLIKVAKEDQKEKLKRISLLLKYKATKLASETGGPELVKKSSHNSKVLFGKFLTKTNKIENKEERNKVFAKFARSCAVVAGARNKGQGST